MVSIVNNVFIFSNSGALYEHGFSKLVVDGEYGLIAMFYGVIKEKTVSKGDFVEFLKAYILKTVKTITQPLSAPDSEDSDPSNCLLPLLKILTNMESLLEKSFSKEDSTVQAAVKNSFDQSCNLKANNFAEVYAKFMHRLLSGSMASLSEEGESQEDTIRRYFKLFAYVQAKDVFKGFYNKRLLKRLMNSAVQSESNERLILSLMKENCGEDFTNFSETIFSSHEKSKILD